MKTRIDLGLDKILLDYYKTEFECIKSYFGKLFTAVESEKKELKSLADFLESNGASEDYIADTLDEDSFNMTFFERNVYNFAAVFLYSECENLLKQDYGILTHKIDKNFFKFDIAKKLYSTEGIVLETISKFSKVNELRILNNCIKHDGYPSDELCKINSVRWVKNKKIELTYEEIIELLGSAETFFDELIPQIESKNEEKLTKENIDLIEKICKETFSSKTDSEKEEIQNIISKLKKI